jgi:SEC-C motif-containing protein
MKKKSTTCPCGSAEALEHCCLPVINGTRAASSAEALMRSRFSAYALDCQQYLLSSWHPTTRPDSIESDPSIQWLRLKIIDAAKRPDQVEFVATFKLNGKAHKMHENSRFIFENGHWFYLGAIEANK